MQSYGKFDRTSTSKVEHNWANVAFADGLLQISRYTGKSVFLSSVACENIRFSSLFAAGDVSRGGTSEDGCFRRLRPVLHTRVS